MCREGWPVWSSMRVTFKMKILFVLSTSQSPGFSRMGSERQAMGQAMALNDMGHEVVVVNILKGVIDWDYGWDVINILNCGGPKAPYILVEQMAHQLGIPVLVTPVYWPTEEVTEKMVELFNYKGEEVDEFYRENQEHFNAIASVTAMSDWVLPNAELEMEQLTKLLKATGAPVGKGIGYSVIPNAVDLENEIYPALKLDELTFSDEIEGLLHERFILSVGRIEPRKNQFNLIRAMNILWDDPANEDLQLVLMGDRGEKYWDYLKKTLKGKHVLAAPSGGAMAVMKMMLRAECHALLSYVETPGLVNLEAAALSRPIVVSDRGTVREYFKDTPGCFYVDPNDPEDIAGGLNRAMEMKEAPLLGNLVESNYNYYIVGQKLISAYRGVIKRFR
jgi:glycosyltransferase involved in cell wall biosynthesis